MKKAANVHLSDGIHKAQCILMQLWEMVQYKLDWYILPLGIDYISTPSSASKKKQNSNMKSSCISTEFFLVGTKGGTVMHQVELMPHSSNDPLQS